MPSTLTSLARSWDEALTAGRCEPALLESLALHGWPDIVRAMAADHLPDAGPRALYAAGMLGYLPGATIEIEELTGLGWETEDFLAAQSSDTVAPSARVDALRAITTHRVGLSEAAERAAAELNIWACRRLGWPAQAERVRRATKA